MKWSVHPCQNPFEIASCDCFFAQFNSNWSWDRVFVWACLLVVIAFIYVHLVKMNICDPKKMNLNHFFSFYHCQTKSSTDQHNGSRLYSKTMAKFPCSLFYKFIWRMIGEGMKYFHEMYWLYSCIHSFALFKILLVFFLSCLPPSAPAPP